MIEMTVCGVWPNTKIQIWKQITTAERLNFPDQSVFDLIQKYKFESKSQPTYSLCPTNMWCLTQYKNTNLKANHNIYPNLKTVKEGVWPNTKIQIWKQITTLAHNIVRNCEVFDLIQKYKFESKSQRERMRPHTDGWCLTGAVWKPGCCKVVRGKI